MHQKLNFPPSLVFAANLREQIAFSIVGAQFRPSNTLSYLDVIIAVPGILFCVEMTIISFSFRPYTYNTQGLFAKGNYSNLIWPLRGLDVPK